LPPHEANADVSPAISDAIVRALAKNADARFATMEELIAAMGATTGSAPRPKLQRSEPPVTNTPDPTSATRPSEVSATGPAQTRSRAGSFALVAVLALAVVAGAVALRGRGESPTDRRSQASASSASATPSSSPAPAVAAELVQRRLTAFSAENEIGALAVNADGSEYAYADGEGVWVAAVAGSTRRRVAMPADAAKDARPWFMDFFPDGKRLLVSLPGESEPAAWIVPLDGSAAVRAREPYGYLLSPDGKRVVISRADDVMIGDLEGGTRTHLLSRGRGETLGLAWSPTGDALAVLRIPGPLGPNGRVEVVAADGSWSHVILSGRTLGNTGGTSPTWTAPDRIAFAETISDDTIAITEVALDASHALAGEPRRVWKEPMTNVSRLHFRGGRFIYLRADSQRDVYVGRLSADHARIESPLARLTTSDSSDSLAGWLPDGRVLFTSTRDGVARVYAQSLKARTPEAISPDGMEAFAVGAIASGEVVAIRHDGAKSSVVALKPGGGVREIFELGAIDVHQGRALVCARCGTTAPSRCVISEAISVGWKASMFDPLTGVRAPPFHHARDASAVYCSLSADGSTLYVPEDSDIAIVDTTTGHSREIRGPSGARIQFALPDGPKALLVSGMSLERATYGLARLDEAGRLTPLWSSDRLWIHAPMLAANGRDLAAIVREFDSDIWMLEPLWRP
jgi:hypothetical protein